MIAKLLSSAAVFTSLAVASFAPLSPFSAQAFAQAAHGIAATVNDDVITTHDLRQRVLFLLMTTGAAPDEEILQRLQAQALQALVDERIQLQEAERFDLVISDSEIERSVAQLAQGNDMTVAQLAEETGKFGVSLNTLRDQVRSEVAWQRIVNGRYGSRIRISDTQIEDTINRMSANIDKPQYLVSEIYIEATPDIGGIEGALEGARAMIEQANNGAPFTALARQFSSAATAARGGDVGWVNQGELRSELDDTLSNMQKNTVSDPIAVPGGVYVLALRDSKVSTSEAIYRVKQMNIDAADEAASAAAIGRIRELQSQTISCDSFEDSVAQIDGANSADMGQIRSSEVNPTILDTLSQTNVSELSEPITVPGGVMALFVCERDVQGSDIPTREQIEDRLIDQQLAQQSRRYLRDLRRSATIESR